MESYFHIQQIQILFQERKKNAKHVSSSEKEDYAELILVAKVRSVRAYCSSAGSLLSFHLLMMPIVSLAHGISLETISIERFHFF